MATLPQNINFPPNLGWLNLSNNQLNNLPISIGGLDHLVSLDVKENKIYKLPPELGLLPELQSLNLEANNLNSLPREVGNLYTLKLLSLRNNSINFLPSEIGYLVNLEKLDVSENLLETIPKEIGELKKLKELLLSSNHLVLLPDEISRLEALEVLDLSNNILERLPKDISDLNSLMELDLRSNPLPIPPELTRNKRDAKIVLSHYFGGIRRQLNESKVLLVGQGSVGKTSLINRLIENKFNPDETKTEGVAIHHWEIFDNQYSIGNKQQSSIHLNIWDFGGQEIMHATHQFFLTKRSLYLLVLDARLTQEENRVEYWLKIIQSFGGESPVLIVGNKIDQHPLDIDRTGLQKKYPNIVGILGTSAATGAGIEALKAAITEQINNLPHVRDLLPETWFTVKIKLENMGRETNFITHDDYDKLCDNNDVHDETSQHTLIGFLHDLGVVLYFQDDPRLESLGILNPQWVTNGVYKILNSHALFQNKGVLTVSMLDEILILPEYPRGKRLFIVDMMRKFELCFDIDDKHFLVPDLLPKDEIYTGEWKDALAFQYHYNVLPTSIITRFIVRMNAFIHKNTLWRSGVVLKSEGDMALVKADVEDRKIYIWVNGEEATRREFLAVIRAEFAAIHKTIAKIEAKEKVPVPDSNAVIDFEHLLKLERKGILDFLPEGMDDSINVRELLNGVEKESVRQSIVRAGDDSAVIGRDVTDSTVIHAPHSTISVSVESKPKSRKKK